MELESKQPEGEHHGSGSAVMETKRCMIEETYRQAPSRCLPGQGCAPGPVADLFGPPVAACPVISQSACRRHSERGSRSPFRWSGKNKRCNINGSSFYNARVLQHESDVKGLEFWGVRTVTPTIYIHILTRLINLQIFSMIKT